jgi:hypothetical protein
VVDVVVGVEGDGIELGIWSLMARQLWRRGHGRSYRLDNFTCRYHVPHTPSASPSCPNAM